MQDEWENGFADICRARSRRAGTRTGGRPPRRAVLLERSGNSPSGNASLPDCFLFYGFAMGNAWGFAPNPTRDQSLDPSSLRAASSRFALSPPQTAFGDNGEAGVGRKRFSLWGWERWDCRPKPCLGLCPKPHQGPVPRPFLASRCIKPLRAFAAVDRLRRHRRSGSWTENDSLYGAGTLGLPSQTLPGAPPRTPQGALPLDPSSLRAYLPAFTFPTAFFPACRPYAGRSPGFCPSYP